jgi:drug/metabolite transporter (DMT)-like permease
MAIAGMRSLIALPFLLMVSRNIRIDWSTAQIGGAVAYALTVILFVSATKLTTAANAILLQYIAPVYVAVLGHYFLDEKVHWIDWIVISITLIGMLLFFLDKLSLTGKWGNILAIASGVAFAFMIVFMRKQKNASPMGSVILGNALTAAAGLPFMLRSMPDRASWIGLFLLGIFQIGLSYVFYTKAIRHVTALEGILIPIVEPILNPVWVLLFIGERPGTWAVVGGAIVILAISSRSLFSIYSKIF